MRVTSRVLGRFLAEGDRGEQEITNGDQPPSSVGAICYGTFGIA